jgi:hypothetical protein
MEGPVLFFLGEGSTAKLLTKDKARRSAANIAKLPELLTRYCWTAWWLGCATGASSSDGIGF